VISDYGMELATRTIVTDGQGKFGIAGGTDSYYGEVELLANAYGADGEQNGDEATATQQELNDQAARNLNGRNPVPVQLRIPDNSSLNPNGVLKMKHLVPGIHVPLFVDHHGRALRQMLKLNAVSVEETARGETIKVKLGPSTAEEEEA
jgi:hypothetical protein